MTISTGVTTILSTQLNAPTTPDDYFAGLAARALLLHDNDWRPNAGEHFLKGMEDFPSYEVRKHFIDSRVALRLTEMFSRKHTRAEFVTLIDDVRKDLVTIGALTLASIDA